MWAELGALGLEIGSTFLQDRMNTRQAREARDWESLMFRNRYQMQVADLKKAGLNPMLAYTQGPGSAPTTSAPQSTKSDISGALLSARTTSAQIANVQADTMKKAAETRNVQVDTFVKGGMIEEVAARTAEAMASAQQSREMVLQIRANLPKIDAEISKIKTEIEKDKSNIRLNDQLAQTEAIKRSLMQAEAILAGQKAAEIEQDVKLREPKVEALEKLSPEARRFRGQSGLVGDWWRSIMPWGKGE